MSEKSFYLVPSNPDFVPSEEQLHAALEFFREVSPECESEKVHIFKHVNFFSSGEHLEAAICPNCNTRLQFAAYPGKAEYANWWRSVSDHQMGQWKDGEQIGLEIAELEMPCCKTRIRLIDLKFDRPCAFGKFALEQLEPMFTEYWEGTENDHGIGTLLKESTLRAFAQKLGCSVVQIWQRG